MQEQGKKQNHSFIIGKEAKKKENQQNDTNEPRKIIPGAERIKKQRDRRINNQNMLDCSKCCEPHNIYRDLIALSLYINLLFIFKF